MKDTQLYEQLLGLSKPWSVKRVELELESNRITVHVECDRGVVWGDPETGQDPAHAENKGARFECAEMLEIRTWPLFSCFASQWCPPPRSERIHSRPVPIEGGVRSHSP